jgi:hypothetical protein
MTDFNLLATTLAAFSGSDLQARVNAIEDALKCKMKGEGTIVPNSLPFVSFEDVVAAKRAFGRINELVHAAGILKCLDEILIPGEIVCSLSLGAGPRSDFDLTTNHRIAEFKFSRWDAGTNAVRKRALIKDYLNLLMSEDARKKQLYVYDKEKVEDFLKSGKGMETLLSKNAQLKTRWENFHKSGEPNTVETIKDLYAKFGYQLELVDLGDYLPA